MTKIDKRINDFRKLHTALSETEFSVKENKGSYSVTCGPKLVIFKCFSKRVADDIMNDLNKVILSYKDDVGSALYSAEEELKRITDGFMYGYTLNQEVSIEREGNDEKE